MPKKPVKMSHNGPSRRNRFSVVLASGSPRRRQMLRELGIPFEIFTPSISEIWKDSDDAADVAKDLARKKASEYSGAGELVIAMDTIVVVEGQKMAKPADRQEAREMLKRLSGRMHKVISGVAMRLNEKMVTDSEETKVYFRRLTEAEIEWYIHTDEPFDKAGGYGIQGLGRIFIDRIDGCYYNVVGFPLSCFQRLLRRLGINLLELRRQEQ